MKNKKSTLFALINIILPIALWVIGQAQIAGVLYFIAFVVYLYIRYKNDFDTYLFTVVLAGIIVGNCIGIHIFSTNIYYCFFLLFFALIWQGLIRKKESVFQYLTKKHIIIVIIVIAYLVFNMIVVSPDTISSAIYSAYWIAEILLLVIVFMNARYSLRGKKILSAINIMFIACLVLIYLEIFGINLGLSELRSELINVFSSNLTLEQEYLIHMPTLFWMNSNKLGVVLFAFSSYYMVSTVWVVGWKKKLFHLLLFSLSVVASIFTSGKIVLIATICILFLCLILVIIKFRKKKLMVISIVSVLICFIGISTLCSFFEGTKPYYREAEPFTLLLAILHLDTESDGGDDKGGGEGAGAVFEEGGGRSIDIRFGMYMDIAKHVINEKKIFGFGAGQSGKLVVKDGLFTNVEKWNEYDEVSIHGLLIEIMGDYGFVGVLMYFALNIYVLFIMLRRYIQSTASSQYYLLSILIVAGMFICGFAPSGVAGLPAYFMMIGLFVGFAGNRHLSNASDNA